MPQLAQHLAESLEGADPDGADRGQELARRHTWDQAARAHEAFYATVRG